MHLRSLKRASLASPVTLTLASLVLAGCSQTVPGDNDESETDTETETESSGEDETATGTESGTTTTSEDETTEADGTDDETDAGADDTPPVIESFDANGSAGPLDIVEETIVSLAAVVTDDVGVDRVEFWDADTLLGTDSEEPYELDWLVSGESFDGQHELTARAYDAAENEAISDTITAEVDNPPGGEIVWWETTHVEKDDRAYALAVHDGRAIVAGTVRPAPNTYNNLHIEARATTDGALLPWEEPKASALNGSSQAWAALIDAQLDRVLVAGYVTGATTLSDTWLRAFDAEGAEVWTYHDDHADKFAHDRARALLLTDSGLIILAGWYGSSSDPRAWVRAFDQDGAPEWVLDLSEMDVDSEPSALLELEDGIGVAGSFDDQRALWTVSEEGELIDSVFPGPGAYLGAATNGDNRALCGSADGEVLVEGVDGAGSQIWVGTTDTPVVTATCRSVAIDSTGAVIAAGSLWLEGSVDKGDIWLGKFDPEGDTLWEFGPLDGDADRTDTASAVATDELGRIYAAGRITNSLSDGNDLWVARLTP